MTVTSLGLLEPDHDANEPSLDQERIASSDVADAIDNPSLVIVNGGDSAWYEQNSVYLIGGSAARSGYIWDNEQSWFETTVNAPFDLNFSWRVSSEEWHDRLIFYINGNYVREISGESGWQNVSIEVAGTGPRTLRWEYSKDYFNSAGLDAGFVDNVQISTCSNKPRNFGVWDPDTSTS
ncbi:MAG: hypothetical protein Q6365_019330, partial [Candidatus Sigynarchaeota archaeon]